MNEKYRSGTQRRNTNIVVKRKRKAIPFVAYVWGRGYTDSIAKSKAVVTNQKAFMVSRGLGGGEKKKRTQKP